MLRRTILGASSASTCPCSTRPWRCRRRPRDLGVALTVLALPIESLRSRVTLAALSGLAAYLILLKLDPALGRREPFADPFLIEPQA